MDARLVLGCGTVGLAVVDELHEQAADLVVVTADPDRAETLRADGVDATLVDTIDADAIATVAADLSAVATIAVLGADPAMNLRAATAAREVLPDTYLFAYVGEEATQEIHDRLVATVDRTYDPGPALMDHIDDRTGIDGSRLRRLRATLADLDGPLAIVTHDNPDPDAIASALALRRIAAAFGVDAEICYYGDISHQENRALINVLEYDLRNLSPGDDVEEYGGVALVDHARPGINDGLPPATAVDIVIDHHPPRGPVDARYHDLRSDVGSTSTLLVDYLRQLALEPDPSVATGLLFGIRVDTQDFRRETSPRDFHAAAYLIEYVDHALLAQIESPSVGTETIRMLAEAITNRHVEAGILTTCVGSISNRDALAQAADHLLAMEGIRASLVYGILDGTVYLSARSRRSGIDLGEVLRDAFDQVGSAGGHADMAGAQIELGMLVGATETDDSVHRAIVDAVVRERFFEVLETRPARETVARSQLDGSDYFDDGAG